MQPIATGVAAGLVTHKATKKLDEMESQGPSYQEQVILLLQKLVEASFPIEKRQHTRSFALQPYPIEYIVNEDWHGYSHFCIFFATETPIRFDVEGVGTYLKTVGPGWVQCDVRGRISTTDNQNHNVIISYREDALGAAL